MHILISLFSWRYLCLATNERGKIPIRSIIKTFSSGKPEKMVQKCLTDLGLAGDKVSFLSVDIESILLLSIFNFTVCVVNLLFVISLVLRDW